MYHLGGKSLNSTLISVNSGIYRIIDSIYDDSAGGEKFDEVLVQHLAAEFKRFAKQLFPHFLHLQTNNILVI